MSDVKRLLAEATPLPWQASGPWESVPSGEWHAIDHFDPDDKDNRTVANRITTRGDAALIVYAVNRLPDYEAAVEALHLLERTADHAIVRLDWDKVSRKERVDRLLELDIAAEKARAALARLREKVPSNV